jgi:succinate-semialdehyde dehydrogenase/glutarate-semialdehyde dehydrogenase
VIPASITPELLTRLGERVTASTSDTAVTVEVFTGDVLATLPCSTPSDVVDAVEDARRVQRAWAEVEVRDRVRVFDWFHRLLLSQQDTLLDIIQAETGKSRRDAFEESASPALTIGYYVRKAARHLRQHRREGMLPFLVQATEVRVPKGVVGIVSPWNYPFALAFTDAVPALIAGNAVVLKPDTQTALSTLYGVDLLYQAGLPEELLKVVIGDGPVVGGALVDSADFVGFTGSTRTGREIAQRAGARLIGCSLELGGKNPLLVLGDANVTRAAACAARSCFANAGQLCMAPERLFVQSTVYDEFVAEFLDQVKKIRLAAGYDFATDMGSLTSASQLATVEEHVRDAVDKGATVLTGGRPRPDIGPLFYEPTVLTDVTPDMRCYSEETFGPVVSIYRVDDDETAIQLANATNYGLNASVFGTDLVRARRVATRLLAGTVNINDGHVSGFGSVGAPMGGMKNSGLGRRNGAEGILKYTEAQNVALQRLPLSTPPRWLPYKAYARGLNRTMRLMRKAGIR